VFIKNNRIHRPYGGGGISVSPTTFDWFPPEYPEFGPVTINGNEITIDGGDWGYGIYVNGSHGDFIPSVAIKDNRIDSRFGGIWFKSQSDSVIADNQIRIGGGAGIWVSDDPDHCAFAKWSDCTGRSIGSSRNVIRENTISGEATAGILIGNFEDFWLGSGLSIPAGSSNENKVRDNDLEELGLVPNSPQDPDYFGDIAPAHVAFLPMSADNKLRGDDTGVVVDYTDNPENPTYPYYDLGTYQGVNSIRLDDD
jgi:hypothetical protein